MNKRQPLTGIIRALSDHESMIPVYDLGDERSMASPQFSIQNAHSQTVPAYYSQNMRKIEGFFGGIV